MKTNIDVLRKKV